MRPFGVDHQEPDGLYIPSQRRHYWTRPFVPPPSVCMRARTVYQTARRRACGCASLRAPRDLLHPWRPCRALRLLLIDNCLVDELTEQLAELALPRPRLRLGQENRD